MRRRYRRPKNHVKYLLILLAIVLAGAAIYFVTKPKKFFNSGDQPAASGSEQQNTPAGWQPAAGSMQSTIESWAKAHKGQYSIVITTPDGTVLADYNSDTEYFTASLYKLFVIYAAYQKVDDGTFDPDQIYLNGWTRAKCIDEAIRSSHSPCAEKLWAEQGKETLTGQMKDLGMTKTSLTGLSTTAADTAKILQLINKSEGLSSASQAAYLDSMKTQDALYRRGLPTGLEQSGATVYNKVGWNGTVEWHDASIVDFGNGKKLIIAALTENAGIANMVDLGKTIAANLPD